MPLSVPWAGLLALSLSSGSAPDALLSGFPLEVACGVAEAGAPASLADLPFDPARGYGYLGGEAGSRRDGWAWGGDPGWPLAWREGCRKYSFHLPNGEYLVTLCFLETEVAAAGLRVFDLSGGEERLLRAVDIAGEAGDFTWLVREALVQVRDGWLDLRFLPAAGSLPPRISRIRIEPAGAVAVSPPAPRGFTAASGPLWVRLGWERPAGPGIAGYGVFRSHSPEGPFESLTELPISMAGFTAPSLPSPGPAFYRVRAYGLRGGQSPFTPPLLAMADPAPSEGLKVVDLRIPEESLAELYTRADPPRSVPGEIRHFGAGHGVHVSCLSEGSAWQSKKSYRIRVGAESRRGLLGRREILLLAQAGDPTLLKEKLSDDVDRLAGLAAPQSSFVHLLLNGRYLGIYLDRETPQGNVKKRVGPERFGTLAQAPGRLFLTPGGEASPETARQSGDLHELQILLQELNRLNEGELDAFFEERFYLDRLIDRLSLAAVRGVDPALPGAAPPSAFLHDSRNGKWELLAGPRQGGDFGIEEFKEPAAERSGAARARRALLAFSLADQEAEPAGRFRLLEGRFLGRPGLKARYLARVEAIARDLLPAAKLAEMARSAQAPLLSALFPRGATSPGDLLLWPQDGGAAFRGGVAAIESFYQAHRRDLLAAVAAERVRKPEPLVLNELFLNPPAAPGGQPTPSGGGWIEIYNAGDGAVDLGRYWLTDDPDRPALFALPAQTLGPLERRLIVFGASTAEVPPVAIGCSLRPSADGGALALYARAPSGRPVFADGLFYGRQTAGLSYSRLPDGAADWGFVAHPTPGAANSGPALAAPPYRFRAGIDESKTGDLTLWFQPTGPPAQVAAAQVHLHEEAQAGYQARELIYNRAIFRHEHVLSRDRRDRRISYYFTARSPDGVERAYPLPGPQAPLRVPVPLPLFINELLPRPAHGGGRKEFVELYNAGDEKVSVDGLFLTDDRRNPTKFRISAREPIPPKGFLLIYTDGLGEGLHANFRLGNAGEYLGLYHRMDEGNLLIDHLVFPAIPVDKSYGREQDGGKGFKVWNDPTPGARNLPRIPPELRQRLGQTKGQGQDPGPGAGRERE